ncbi:MAG: FAD-binding oxidoreductase [Actinobacteria bacterium]|nr:FAD-binding oxidoreductase [Actinomycetota bacterium]
MSETGTLTFKTISEEAYRALEEAVGPENVSREPGVLDGYAWQPTNNDHPTERWVKRPVAVVLPASTEEVQAVVRACNRHGLRFKAFSTGWGVWCGPTYDNVVQVDLRRMNRILEIDEKNMYAVVEPYAIAAQIQAEAMKKGLNLHIHGSGPNCSPLASATSGWGVGHDSIYMSYSPRNVLGAEWVLPDGEVLRLGAPGCGLGWFSGDGPGPSLRGIMRGSAGALSGLGIFTKCALKLYHWPGPPRIETEGCLLDARSEIPENMGFYLCAFPDRSAFLEAVLKIGEAEIGYNALRTATAAYLNIMTPRLFKKLAGTRAVRSLLGKTLEYVLMMVLAADSEEELAYQSGVLLSIVEKNGGIALDMGTQRPFVSMALMGFVRATLPALVFRIGGSFNTALDRNDALDTQENWRDACLAVKEEWIARGGIIDDMGDNPYYVPYENNTWAHCEVVYQFDPRKPEHRAALEPIFLDFTIAALEQCMEPMFSSDPRVRAIIGPLAWGFNRWQKEVSRTLDPGEAADSTLYCGEGSFDLSAADPTKVERLNALTEKLRPRD